MSAIWGAINLQGQPIPKQIKDVMRAPYNRCVIDRFEETSSDNWYFGCGIQYFYQEAKSELLPYQESGYVFTADVVLDNREEIKEKYNLEADNKGLLVDGAIMYQAFKKARESSLDEFLGAYAAVFYSMEENSVKMWIDAVGDRCLYYSIQEDTLYFSSLLEPLIQILKPELNDQWITDFLAMDHLYVNNEVEFTPYKNIYRIPPATVITVTKGKVIKTKYWDPMNTVLIDRSKTEEEYQKEFRDILEAAVRCTLRKEDNISILLSGGLDSTVVACIASKYLKQKHQNLHSYTSVPISGYQHSKDQYYLEDEKELVLKTKEFLGNLECEFLDLQGKNAWNSHQKELQDLEVPYKSVQNMLWISEALRIANRKDSRIMLSGSYGNTTISYTDLEVYTNSLYRHHKYFKLMKELRKFSKENGFKKSYAIKSIIRSNRSKKKNENQVNSMFGKSFVRQSMIDQSNAVKRHTKMYDELGDARVDYQAFRKFMTHDRAFVQIGETGTKHSLATGSLLRDPTKDKRIIEFCMSLPMEQYCKDGVERRLVREYLKDIMPTHIVNDKRKGRQSADLQYRLSLDWNSIRKEWLDLFEMNLASKYVNSSMARSMLLKRNDIWDFREYDMARFIYTLSILEIEAKNNKENEIGLALNESKEALISVIIPVYSAEAYLRTCLDSVVNQTYKNIEILLIDDESNDLSKAICEEYQKEDSRVKLYSIQHQGVSKARNKGLECAKGDIIAFVDSDDWIEPEMYETMIKQMNKFDAQLVCCAYKKVLSDHQVVDNADNEIYIFYEGEMLDTFLFGKGIYLSAAIWNKIYRRELFQDISFPKMNKYEDRVVSALTLSKVTRGVYINQSFYHYHLCEGSLTNRDHGIKDIQDLIEANEIILDISRKRGNKLTYANIVFTYFCLLLSTYCKVEKQKDKKKEKKLLVSQLKKYAKEARIGCSYKEGISRNSKRLMKVSTYSISLYIILNQLLRIRKKLQNIKN